MSSRVWRLSKCVRKLIVTVRDFIPLEGKVFGQLKVLRYDRKLARWICVCSCGKEAAVESQNLRSGRTRSCGCRKYVYMRESKAANRKAHVPKRDAEEAANLLDAIWKER